jgi:hypothetical protein
MRLNCFAQRLGVSTNTDFSSDRVYMFVASLFAVISMHVRNCDVKTIYMFRHFVVSILAIAVLTDCSRLLHDKHIVLCLAFCYCSFITVFAKISVWHSP